MAISIRGSSAADSRATVALSSPPVPRRVGTRAWWLQAARNRLGLFGGVVILLTIFEALAAPLIAPYDPSSQAFRRLLPPVAGHLMGTDELGRDTLSRIIFGAQVSLQVGGLAVAIGLCIGTLIGLLSGYYAGPIDDWLMRLVDILSAFPGLILAIVISGLLGPSRTNAMIAIGIVFAPAFARVVRGAVLSVMQEGYIEAARVMGIPDTRIIAAYVLPNITAAIMVMTSAYLSSAILTEASLSYLGLGAQPPEPSWGGMLSAARDYMELSPWLAVFPGAAIMLVVLGFNFLGDGLRDILDPRLRNV